MRAFRCACGARIFFENSVCLSCGRELGFAAERSEMVALEPDAEAAGVLRAAGNERRYRKCENHTVNAVCNWVVPAEGAEPLCQACRLNDVIPDLSQPDNRERWAKVESAKRRLVYSLNSLGLPPVPKSVDPVRGLAFDIKSDEGSKRVLTGHADGLITLNVKEADPVLREKARLAMSERYRTLLGHFRHEIGHYYWDVLIRDGERLAGFRELFGDEQIDYNRALGRYYAAPPSADWKGTFVSRYATAHPWEDWAETWAHYLHMVDTLETAAAYGIESHELGGAIDPGADFDDLMRKWLALTVALNALNRSMGQEDPYPFEIGDGARTKLAYVHAVITDSGRNATSPPNGEYGLSAAPREPAAANAREAEVSAV